MKKLISGFIGICTALASFSSLAAFDAWVYDYESNTPAAELQSWEGVNLVNTSAGSANATFSGVLGSEKYCFDGKLNTRWIQQVTNPWVIYKFPAVTKITSYALRQATNNGYDTRVPVSFELYGSNAETAPTTATDESWVVLDARTQVFHNYNRGSYDFGSRVFWLGHAASYRYYLLKVLSNNGDSYTVLGQLEFYNQPFVTDLAFKSGPVISRQDGVYKASGSFLCPNDCEIKAVVSDGENEVEETVGSFTGSTEEQEFVYTLPATLSANKTYSVNFLSVRGEVEVETSTAAFYTGALTLTKTNDASEEGLTPAELTVSRASADPVALPVTVILTEGTAQEGVNYGPMANPVVIPAGATSATFQVTPLLDNATKADTELTVSIGCDNTASEGVSVAVVIANITIPSDKNVWVAGASSDGLASTASNWSKGVPRADSPESLVILVDGNYSTQSMTWNADGTTDLAATVTSWMQTTEYQGTVTFKTTFPNASSSFKTFTVTGDMVVNGGAITHPVSANWDNMSSANLSLDALRESYVYRLNLAAGNFTLGAGAKIDAAGKGHSWLRKTGNVKACTPSHGGRYETTSIGCYGNPKYPEDVGLASNLGTDSLSKCAVGGGAVKLSVVGSCVINGEVTVDGTIGSGSLGAGAAGSVLIEAARVTGAGLIHADGIYGGNTGQYNGTGGRIALLTTEAVDMTTLTVRAGGSATGKYAPEGTVYLKDASMTHGVLCLNNPLYTSSNATPNRGAFVTNEEGVDWTFDAIRLNGHVNLYVTEGTTLTLPNGFASVTAPDNTSRVSGIYYRGGTLDVGTGDQTIGGGMWYFYPSVRYPFAANLTVDDGAAIGSCSYWEVPAIANSAAPTSAWKVLFSVAGNMTIGTNGAVTANTAGLGQQSGTQYAGVVIGAHGGRRTATGATMDSVFNPHVPGVFQSNSYGYVKAGGVIDFTVGGLLTLDGKILSDAPDTADGGRGNASGGAINISAGTIAGAGPISAAAKRDVQCGGRIAVKLTGSGATFADYTGSLCAKSGGNTTAASAGSVYLQGGAEADKTGVIIIDNFNNGGLTTPICATGYEADAADDFKKASLVVRNKGYAQVAVVNEKGEFKMKEIEICANSKLDLYGKNFIVQKATLNGTRLAPGVYKASDYPESLADSLGTDGTLQVSGSGLKFFIR